MKILYLSQMIFMMVISKRSVLGGSARIVLHFFVIELKDCFDSFLTGGDKKTAMGVSLFQS